MTEHDQQSPATFTLDRRRLAAHQEHEHAVTLGVSESMPGGLTGSLCERLKEANEGAITGPEGYEVHAYSIDDGDLTILVSAASGPRVSHEPIEAKHIRPTPEGSFEELCATIEWILERANPMLDLLQDVRQARGETEPQLTLLHRVARELLDQPIGEAYDDQDADERVTREEFEQFLGEQADELARRLRETVEVFNVDRAMLPVRGQA